MLPCRSREVRGPRTGDAHPMHILFLSARTSGLLHLILCCFLAKALNLSTHTLCR